MMPSTTRHARAYTLVEVTLCTAIMAILMTGMGSAMIIASQGIPGGNSPIEIAAQSRQVVEDIASDLLYATSLTEKSANAVTFTVADRNHGDPGPETISYSWSGTPGDPLTLEYNGSTAVTVFDNVHDFQLIYNVSVDTDQSIPPIESPEAILSSHDTSAKLMDFAMKQKDWIGQYFEAQLPPDVRE